MRKLFTKEDESYMRMALQKAVAGVSRGQTPFGACIVCFRQGRATVVALEHNRVWDATDITAHAEVRAIRAACRKLKTISLSECVIYSTCEPCPMCFSACHWAGLRKIFYGASIRDAKAAGFNELFISVNKMKTLGRSPIRISGGLLNEDNVRFLKDWGKRKEKKTY